MNRFLEASCVFDPRGRLLQVGRSIIALSQLSVILFTKTSNLLAHQHGEKEFPHCDSVLHKSSIYCVSPGSNELKTFIIAAILVSVIAGIRPQITCILHFWAALSIGLSWSLPDGGESVARVITFLLIPVCLWDTRNFAWGLRFRKRYEGVASAFSFVFMWAIRLQISLIYFASAISKFAVPEWADGTAEYYIVRDGMFGSGGLLGGIMHSLTDNAFTVIALTWGSLVIEILIAICVLFPNSGKVTLIVLEIMLHGGIIFAMGLWSFGGVMVGSAIVAAVPVVQKGLTYRSPDEPREVGELSSQSD